MMVAVASCSRSFSDSELLTPPGYLLVVGTAGTAHAVRPPRTVRGVQQREPRDGRSAAPTCSCACGTRCGTAQALGRSPRNCAADRATWVVLKGVFCSVLDLRVASSGGVTVCNSAVVSDLPGLPTRSVPAGRRHPAAWRALRPRSHPYQQQAQTQRPETVR
jgi:hypothetical protein